ncbi:MAG: hypothetical protein Q9207_007834, partial [Kuettlingeria erythrocarpa]
MSVYQMDPYHGHSFGHASQDVAVQQNMLQQQAIHTSTPSPDIKIEASTGTQANESNFNEPGYGLVYLEQYSRATEAAPTSSSYYGRSAGGPIHYQNEYEKIMQQCRRAQGQQVSNDNGGYDFSCRGPTYSAPEQVLRTTGTAMNENFGPSYGLPFRQVNYNAHPSSNLDVYQQS